MWTPCPLTLNAPSVLLPAASTMGTSTSPINFFASLLLEQELTLEEADDEQHGKSSKKSQHIPANPHLSFRTERFLWVEFYTPMGVIVS